MKALLSKMGLLAIVLFLLYATYSITKNNYLAVGELNGKIAARTELIETIKTHTAAIPPCDSNTAGSWRPFLVAKSSQLRSRNLGFGTLQFCIYE